MIDKDPSPQQLDFFDWVLDGSGSAILEAVAGAGKTWTLTNALALMDGSVFLGAYNKKIATELQTKAKLAGGHRKGVYISTMHAAGYSSWLWHCGREGDGKPKVEERKTDLLIDQLLETSEIMERRVGPARPYIRAMVGYGKQYALGIAHDVDDVDHWLRISDHFSAEMMLPDNVLPEEIIPTVIKVYLQSARQCSQVVDFDDMIFAPLYHGVRLPRNDWVLIDEAQDINPARRLLAKKMLRRGGRFVGVGDRNQAIYGFSGADADSIDNLKKEFGCTELPLTVSFRCPKKVVEYAHQWVTHISSADNAPDGVVRGTVRHDGKPWFLGEQPPPDAAILCRYTAPLIKTAYGMIKHGIACQVEGREIGRGLLALATKWRVKRLDVLTDRLERWREVQVSRAKTEVKQQEIEDKVDTLNVLIERCTASGRHEIGDLRQEIETMFADDVCGKVTLSTGHKAKGREWEKVYWLRHTVKRRALQKWEQRQEDNLNYVICTRAMRELILIPEWDQETSVSPPATAPGTPAQPLTETPAPTAAAEPAAEPACELETKPLRKRPVTASSG